MPTVFPPALWNSNLHPAFDTQCHTQTRTHIEHANPCAITRQHPNSPATAAVRHSTTQAATWGPRRCQLSSPDLPNNATWTICHYSILVNSLYADQAATCTVRIVWTAQSSATSQGGSFPLTSSFHYVKIDNRLTVKTRHFITATMASWPSNLGKQFSFQTPLQIAFWFGSLSLWPHNLVIQTPIQVQFFSILGRIS